jgi:hypothetical protein
VQRVIACDLFMKKISIFFLLLTSGFCLAQPPDGFRFRLDKSVPLRIEERSLTMPWAGGLNGPEYNTLDLDFDGKEDLVLYERTAQKVVTFLARENEYVYAPEYETMFPTQVYNWLLLRDFDCDGRKDIFTGHIFGMSVYRNTSSGNTLQWELFPFYDGNAFSEAVLTKGFSGKINLQLQFDDLPSISDADGDGDIDVFAMNYGGSGTIEFHKNFSVERYGTCDSLDFERVDNWWGGVRECECGKFVFDEKDCSSLPGRVEHAGGKSLLYTDADGDGLKDMLVSEGECAQLYLLPNKGSLSSPDISEAIVFPSVNSATFLSYPTAYLEDVDFDGTTDLIATPNIYSKADPQTNLRESNWFYKNIGTDAAPQYVLQTKTFLQDQMLDVGDNAVPAFADVDGDADLDMLVSNNGSPSVITLYRNIGTPFEPSFELADNDFRSLSDEGYTNIRLRVLDIDGDGKDDLVFTGRKQNSNTAQILFIRNKGSRAMDFAGQPVESIPFSYSNSESISFIDVDRDGRLDLLYGKGNGAVEYWRNQSRDGFDFVKADDNYLGITSSVVSISLWFEEADLNGDGKQDLLISDQTGQIRVVADFRNASDISSAFNNIVYNENQGQYYSPNLGGRVYFTTADLYGVGLPVIAAGTRLGGVRLLKNEMASGEEAVLNVYPNPVHPTDQLLTITTNKMAQLSIYAATGQQTRSSFYINAREPLFLSFRDYAAGMYLLQFIIDNKTYIRRLIVR